MSVGPLIKVCGLTRVEDAQACVDLGVDALGLNFWPRSVRRCSDPVARQIVERFVDRVRLVAVVVDAAPAELRRIRHDLGVPWVQFHGDEPAEAVTAWLPDALKAVRVGGPEDLPAARRMPGAELLVDARVPGMPGGTGAVCDWASAARLARERVVWLAGGLGPDNVAEAVREVDPFGVDLASGVESSPGVKDPARVAALVSAVRGQ
ncbi:MAG: N-(5'-phosphoribosyl)anthranilate isomerase [Sandaracinaceae bacterium]